MKKALGLIFIFLSMMASVRQQLEQFEQMPDAIEALEGKAFIKSQEEELKLLKNEIKVQKEAIEVYSQETNELIKVRAHRASCKKDLVALKKEIAALAQKIKKLRVKKDKAYLQELKEHQKSRKEAAFKIPCADILIMYDQKAMLNDNNYPMGKNSALPKEINDLFSQQVIPFFVNGAIGQVILHFIKEPEDDSYKSEGLTFIREGVRDFKEEDWELYVMYNPEPGVLFIPKKYLDTHSSRGFNLEGLDKFEKKDVAEVLEKLKKTPDQHKKIAEALLSLFKAYDEEDPVVWNIIISGHGKTDVKGGRKGLSITLSYIARIPLNQFISLLEGFAAKIKPNVTIWNTCYGGGLNAASLQQIVELIKTFKKDFDPGILLSTALADQWVGAGEKANFEEVSNSLSAIRNGVSSYRSIMNNLADVISALGYTPLDTTGLVYIPEVGKFEPLTTRAVEGDDAINIYNIKEESYDKPLVLDHSTDKIRFIAPGEVTEQFVQNISSRQSLSALILFSIFRANEPNVFFKIINVDELAGTVLKGDSFEKLGIDFKERAPFYAVLHDVKIIIFPVKLACCGYMAFSIEDSFPRTLYLVKIMNTFVDYKFKLVDKFLIKNNEELDQKMRSIQQQALVNGIFEKSFIDCEGANVSSALNMLEEPMSIKKNSEFKELLRMYDIAPNVFPNKEALSNVLMNIANDCKYGVIRLTHVGERKKIIEHIKELDEETLSLLEEGCVDSNLINIPLALELLPKMSPGLLKKIQENFKTEPMEAYEDMVIDLINRSVMPESFMKAAAQYGSPRVRADIYRLNPSLVKQNSQLEKAMEHSLLKLEKSFIDELILLPELYKSDKIKGILFCKGLSPNQIRKLLMMFVQNFPSVQQMNISMLDDIIVDTISWGDYSEEILKILGKYGSVRIKEEIYKMHPYFVQANSTIKNILDNESISIPSPYHFNEIISFPTVYKSDKVEELNLSLRSFDELKKLLPFISGLFPSLKKVLIKKDGKQIKEFFENNLPSVEVVLI